MNQYRDSNLPQAATDSFPCTWTATGGHTTSRTLSACGAILGLLLLAFASTPCFAVSNTFYGTGTAGLNADPNYMAVFPIGPSLYLFGMNDAPASWVAPPPGTGWVNQFGNGEDYHSGTFDYQTTFNWNGGELTGVFAASSRASIFLDNAATGIQTSGPNGFDHLTAFDLGVLAPGQHVLDFIVVSQGGAPGLLVAPTPEPTSMLMLGSSVLGIAGLLRRKFLN